MNYRMKQEYLKNNFWSGNSEDEKYLTEYLTRGIFHKWNDKLEILTRICDCGHLEYETLDHMLVDWLDELKKNEGSYKFDEEIAFIESMFKPNRCTVTIKVEME